MEIKNLGKDVFKENETDSMIFETVNKTEWYTKDTNVLYETVNTTENMY